jgi:hypothetical protein
MPQVQREDIPRALMEHLAERIRQREVGIADLQALAEWLDTKPEVPSGDWYKRFTTMIVCGRGTLVRTFLRASQTPMGNEV